MKVTALNLEEKSILISEDKGMTRRILAAGLAKFNWVYYTYLLCLDLPELSTPVHSSSGPAEKYSGLFVYTIFIALNTLVSDLCLPVKAPESHKPYNKSPVNLSVYSVNKGQK